MVGVESSGGSRARLRWPVRHRQTWQIVETLVVGLTALAGAPHNKELLLSRLADGSRVTRLAPRDPG